MKIKKTGTTYEFFIEGPIGEACPLFGQDVRGATRIVIDAEKMTYINSIGVKNWILWTVRVPAGCPFVLKRAPLVMISQVSQVVGFMPPRGVVESFNAPFVCPDCNTEKTALLKNGADYLYGNDGQARGVNLPKLPCPKCGTQMEPDFLESKVFTFLGK